MSIWNSSATRWGSEGSRREDSSDRILPDLAGPKQPRVELRRADQSERLYPYTAERRDVLHPDSRQCTDILSELAGKY